MKHQIVTLTLIVKTDEPTRATENVRARIGSALTEWLHEDPSVPPFPEGTLLCFNIHAQED